jgi:hypothetical protein
MQQERFGRRDPPFICSGSAGEEGGKMVSVPYRGIAKKLNLEFDLFRREELMELR